MGYYDYQNGLIHRHLDQNGEWDSHLEHCRRYILKSVEIFKPETVTILGSGWLLDLPLAEILEKTKKVILIDIIHPPDVIRQVAEFENVELIEADVTGGLIEEVWNRMPGMVLIKRPLSLSGINVPLYKPGFDPGLVISLNLLTQLENLPIEFIKKRSKVREEDLDNLRREIQKKHIEFLTKSRSVLISDVEEIYTGKSGSVETVRTLYTDITHGESREDWTWNFDVNGSDYYNTTSVMKVVAITFAHDISASPAEPNRHQH